MAELLEALLPPPEEDEPPMPAIARSREIEQIWDLTDSSSLKNSLDETFD